LPHRLQDSFFRALFHSPIAGMAVGDTTSLSIIEVNATLLEMLGRTRDEIVDRPEVWLEITPSEYHHLDRRALEQFLERGHSDPFEKEYVRSDGSRIPVRVSVSGVDDHPDKMIVFVQDIGAERLAHQREQAIQARLEIALSAAEQGIWDYDLVTGEMIYSERAKQIYGFPLDRPVTFEQVRDATHPEDLPVTIAQLQRAIDPAVRDRSPYEYRIVRPDGGICWALAFGEAVFEGPPGDERAVRYAGTIQDITARKTAERHQQVLIAELNHRVKNMLAVVQSLAFQTFNGTVPQDVADRFNGRLAALAAAHDILTRDKWEAASMRDIARAVLEPHLGTCNPRILLDGDDARLHPQLAVNLAMALHELATNAAKYGALSNGSGRVDLAWQVGSDADRQLWIHWRESGGPPVSPPEHQGFGTRMLRRVLASDLDGSVDLAFHPQGLECSIRAPIRAKAEPA
jgi:PAS domain S-box-containing protein